MATEDLVPTYLQEIFNRAIPNQLTDNEPLQAFTAPLDETSLKDVLSVVTSTHPSLYGAAKYGAGNYQARQDLTYGGGVITDAYRALALDGDGLAAPGGIGIWSSTTNQMRNGGAKTNLSFASAIGGATLTRDTTIAPKFGAVGAGCFKIVTGTAVNDGYFQSSSAGLALPAGTVYTMSTWMRGASGGEVVNLWGRVNNTDSSLNDGNPTTCTLSTLWLRFSATVTVAAAKTGDFVSLMARQPGTTSQTYYLDGAQAEPQAVATPYVYTDGATRVRSAARLQVPATLLSAVQGWVAMRVRMGFSKSQAGLDGGANVPLFFWTTSASGVGTSYLWGAIDGGSGNVFTQCSVSGSGSDSSGEITTSYNAGDGVTLVFAWDSSNLYVSYNGSAFTSAARAHGIPQGMYTSFDIGAIGGSRWLQSTPRWIACGIGKFSVTDLANLYALGDTVPSFSQFSSTNYCTGIVLGTAATPILLLGP